MRRLPFFVSSVLVALTVCSEGITAPKCERCDEMRVLTDRPEYRPGSTIAFTISNRTTAVLPYDWCSVGLASRGNGDDFPPATYSPARRCGIGANLRSEEHTSELQSQSNLVCRLLLEKKKKLH